MFVPSHADEHSRVRLADQNGEGYINANWVPLPQGSMIITQGPLEHTQEQFEQMIVENQLQCVAMLCNIIEGGKVRCFDYTANRRANILGGEDTPITISMVEL
jgi:protein tyrosine phosphatase